MGGRDLSWGMGHVKGMTYAWGMLGYVWGLLSNHGVTRAELERERGGGGKDFFLDIKTQVFKLFC